MIQCFTSNDDAQLNPSEPPRLVAVSRIDSSFSIHPRIMHKHEDMLEVLFVRSGSGVYIIDEKRYPIKKGDLIICNAGALHDEDPDQNKELNNYCITIKNLQIDGLPPNHLVPEDAIPVINAGSDYKDISRLYGTMFSQLSSGLPGVEQACHYLMLGLLSIFNRILDSSLEHGDETATDLRLLGSQIKEYLDTHYQDDLNLAIIAEATNLSTYYLSHVFKRYTGYSPMQYIMRRRLGEAQTLLITTSDSITDIASEVGYGNPNYFNVIFTKNIGMSPSQYRKEYTRH